ncbi:MAG: hypothetical protein K9N09_09235 [Candidatus Cloacimonetes bacterium]|nr:hypothetical protein [Candidatus Cloacimonadota bacterium]MCF7814180.1 hypothetical protein [Candidatus Cloacimonadota bacterium]MCF7868871.1 hypothetical protein [Candidatus Cloacimonadota bacterium]MCF7884236.1 hypothetical protein [Candidatus Cloacimonadota bacterium]
MKAKIKEILRPDVFRIQFDDNVTKMLIDRRILYLIKNSENYVFLMMKLKELLQNRTVDILRSEALSKGLCTGRIYIEGRHISSYLG